MNAQYKISPKNAKRFVKIILIELIFLLVLLFVSVILKNILFVLAGLLVFFCFICTYVAAKKMTKQSITIYDDKIHYLMTAGETVEVYFRDISFAGFYKKDFTKTAFAFQDGLYLYCDNIDRYFLIGSDFDNLEELYENIQTHCKACNVSWKNIKRERNIAITTSIQHLLEKHSPEF